MDSIYDFICDYLRNEFMKKIGLPVRIISAINTIMNLDGYSIIQLILAHFGFAKFVSWVFWVSIIF